MNNNPSDEPSEYGGSPQDTSSSLNFDQEPATQPQTGTPSESPEPAPAVSPAKPKAKARKPLIVGLVAAVLVLLIGGGAAAYKFWYQDPERVVTSALVGALQSDNLNTHTTITSDSELSQGILSIKMKKLELIGNGSLSSATGETEAKLSLELNGRDYKVGAKAMMIDDRTIYFQVNDVKELVTKLADDYSTGDYRLPSEAVQQLETIQNKWVKVTTDDMGEDAESFTCVLDAVEKAAKDPKYTEESKQTYLDNKFLKVSDEVKSKDGNLGYKVSIDSKKLESYAKASEDSLLAKELKKCPGYEESASNDEDGSTTEDAPESKEPTVDTTVWVSRFGHELKQVDYKITSQQINSDQDMVFEGQTKFSYEDVKIEKPADSTSLEDWQADVEKFVESIQEAFMNGMINAAESTSEQPAASV